MPPALCRYMGLDSLLYRRISCHDTKCVNPVVDSTHFVSVFLAILFTFIEENPNLIVQNFFLSFSQRRKLWYQPESSDFIQDDF